MVLDGASGADGDHAHALPAFGQESIEAVGGAVRLMETDVIMLRQGMVMQETALRSGIKNIDLETTPFKLPVHDQLGEDGPAHAAEAQKHGMKVFFRGADGGKGKEAAGRVALDDHPGGQVIIVKGKDAAIALAAQSLQGSGFLPDACRQQPSLACGDAQSVQAVQQGTGIGKVFAPVGVERGELQLPAACFHVDLPQKMGTGGQGVRALFDHAAEGLDGGFQRRVAVRIHKQHGPLMPAGHAPAVGDGPGIEAVDQQQRTLAQKRDSDPAQEALPKGGNGRAGRHVEREKVGKPEKCQGSGILEDGGGLDGCEVIDAAEHAAQGHQGTDHGNHADPQGMGIPVAVEECPRADSGEDGKAHESPPEAAVRGKVHHGSKEAGKDQYNHEN